MKARKKPASWKNWPFILLVLSVVPAAVILVRAYAAGPPPPERARAEVAGGAGGPLGTPTPEPFRFTGREPLRVVSLSIERDDASKTAYIIGEVENASNRPLTGAVGAGLEDVRSGRLVAVGLEEARVGPIYPGERAFFRVSFVGSVAWEATRRQDVVARATVRTAPVPQ